MRLLLPAPDPSVGAAATGADGELDDADLARLYAYPEAGASPWVRANFVSTLDGAASGADGRSRSINTGVDRAVFALLRALSDVILVGAATARLEGYRRVRVGPRWESLRHGRAVAPTTAVVTRSAVVPERLLEAREAAGDILLVTCLAAGAKAIEAARQQLGDERVLVRGADSVDLSLVIDDLAARGLGRVLCEGGPRLMRDLVASGRLDELCLTLAPRIAAGGGSRITVGQEVAAQLVPQLLLESEGTLLGSWVRAGSRVR